MSEEMKQPLLASFGFSVSAPAENSDVNRRVPILSDMDPVLLKQQQRAYPRNIIVSSRYNLINFFPKSLLEQFRRLANVYFLVIGIIATIGYYTNYYETAVQPAGILLPVTIVVCISIIKDGVEDVKRHRADHVINTKKSLIVDSDGIVRTVLWQDLKVGDVLLVLADSEIPADAVVLCCGGVQGPVCYVETAAIDGETNLKLKIPAFPHVTTETTAAAVSPTSGSGSSSATIDLLKDRSRVVGPLESLRCTLVAETPNSSIHRFNAFVESEGSLGPSHVESKDSKSPLPLPHSSSSRQPPQPQQIALTEKNLLLRGSTLRATEWCLAVVTYSGAHTKLSLNSKRTPSKLSSVDRIVNRTLAIAISTMIFVCILSMILEIIWFDFNDQASYLCLKQTNNCESAAPSSYLTIFTFATLYNNFVCISMYVSLEMVYLMQGYFLSHDLSIYDPETDTPAECHTSGMCADLGQIQYVLSDKTGTLTKNVMVVQQISVANKVFGKPLHTLEPLLPTGEEAQQQPSIISMVTSSSVTANNRNHSHNSYGSSNSGHHIYSGRLSEVSGRGGVGRASRLNPNDLDLQGINDPAALLQHTVFYPSLEVVQTVYSHGDSSGSTEEQQLEQEEEREERLLMLMFLRVLVYCNTAMLMPDEQGKQGVDSLQELSERLQAESADEVALILVAAESCGVLLERRTGSEISASGLRPYFTPPPPDQHQQLQPLSSNSGRSSKEAAETVELLAVNEFDSDRKMMSVVIRLSGGSTSGSSGSPLLKGRTFLLAKGADSSILARAMPNANRYLSLCRSHVDYFANTGLRTLAMAYRELSDEELLPWLQEHRSACSSIAARKELMQEAATKIERNLIVVGAIGIEDELQDGVSEAINTLHSAGINVWMITGDKAETAVAIGKKCALIQPSRHEIEKIVGLADEALRQKILDLHSFVCRSSAATAVPPVMPPSSNTVISPLTGSFSAHNNANSNTANSSSVRGSSSAATATATGRGEKEVALIIDGLSLEGIWANDDLRNRFVEVVQVIPTVIACRVSPLQKAALVRMVKAAPSRPVILGIGDGANDVGMIHEARVGVGISGREGRHAANAADFAIAQFRFLIPLLFDHGRFNYIRCSKLVLYSFFKNLLLVSVLFYYCTYSGFSGTIPLDSIVFSGFNFYLGLPILVVGATDWDIPREDVLRFPFESYATGRLGEMLNLKNFAKWCGFAFVQGLLLFTVTVRFLAGPAYVSESSDGYWSFNLYGAEVSQPDNGRAIGIFAQGFILYTAIIMAMQIKVAAISATPNLFFWALWLLSLAGYLLFAYVYGLFPSQGWYNTVPLAMASPQFWLVIFAVPLLLTISDEAVQLLWRLIDPSYSDRLQVKLENYRLYGDATVDRGSAGQPGGGGSGHSGGVMLRNMSNSLSPNSSRWQLNSQAADGGASVKGGSISGGSSGNSSSSSRSNKPSSTSVDKQQKLRAAVSTV